jgi:small nuclear ribonucleoprotein (snRNP)-like protein
MRWEESVLALFEDLEQQAEGLHLAERDAEIGELSVSEYAQVSLGSRIHASTNQLVRVRLLGGRSVTGRLAQSGRDWMLLEDDPGHEWVVPQTSVATVSGLSTRSLNEDAWPLHVRLSLRSILRRIAQARSEIVVHLTDGSQFEGRLGRVGKDFVEVYPAAVPVRAAEAVPNVAIAAIQGR